MAERQGIGSALYTALFEWLAAENVHRAFAGIPWPSPGSVAWHERFGLRHRGTFEEVGRKLGRLWEGARYQKELDPGEEGAPWRKGILASFLVERAVPSPAGIESDS